MTTKIEHKEYYKKLFSTDSIYLEDCYDKFSRAKEKAYNYCLDFYEELDGYHFRITGYNCNTFTCAYLFDTSENQYIIVHTRTYDYIGVIK